MSTQPVKRYSAEEYLAIERESDTKHEFYAGDLFAMSGASREHNLIAYSLARVIGNALEDRPCEAYGSDMRVKVDRTGLYTYPDGVVTCEEPRFEDDQVDTLMNPQVVFEILSDSTEKYDRGKKFAHYRQIESLRDYVLISQDEPLVEHYARQADGRWSLDAVGGLESTARLETIGVELPLAELYAKVRFEAEA